MKVPVGRCGRFGKVLTWELTGQTWVNYQGFCVIFWRITVGRFRNMVDTVILFLLGASRGLRDRGSMVMRGLGSLNIDDLRSLKFFGCPVLNGCATATLDLGSSDWIGEPEVA